MSEAVQNVTESNSSVDFDPILPDTGVLFYEECLLEYEIQKPRLLPLKSTTQIRYDQLQQEAARVWKEKQGETKNKP